jgi:nitrile hydratase
MNTVHDLGGMQNFGPVEAEADEPVFHSQWERRVFALTLAMAALGRWNIDISRHARESLPPAQYLSSSYYEIWLAALEKLMIERGLVSAEEIDQGQSRAPALAGCPVLQPGAVAAALARGAPADRPPTGAARFAVGKPVRALNINPQGHTRLPRYARGRVGTVIAVHGCHVLPDTNAHGEDEQPTWLYGVRFAARELWGPEARDGDHVHLDLWETYLEPA